MRTIFIYISHGAHVRNLVNLGFARSLAQSFEIVFLTWPEDVASLQAYVGDLGLVEALPYRPRRFEGQLAAVRRYVMISPRRNRTVNLFSLSMKHDNPGLYRVLRAANLTIGRWKAVRSAWTAIERRLLPLADALLLIDRHRPAAVIAANYGADPDVMRLFTAAARRGVPTVAVVPSWDNLSSKGVMGAKASLLVVWNAVMRREADAFHDFPMDRVKVAGPMQFDSYGPGHPRHDRASLSRTLDLDPARPYVVYGTITPKYFPHNLEVVRHLAELSEGGALTGRPQVVVRIHPQVVDDPVFGERLEAYEALAAAFPGTVRLNVPKVMKWGRLRPAPEGDQILLADMLYHAAACLVPGSTLALDAIAAGCPAIGIAYDGDAPDTPYHQSIRRWYDYEYFKPLLDLDGLPLAGSREELREALDALLRDRDINLLARNRVVAELVGKLDGAASRRCAEAVLDLVGRSSNFKNRPVA